MSFFPNNQLAVVQAIQHVLDVSGADIARASSFVELGGDSLSAILVAAKCLDQGFSMTAGQLLRTRSLRETIKQAAHRPAVKSVVSTNSRDQRQPIHLQHVVDLQRASMEDVRMNDTAGLLTVRHVLDHDAVSEFQELQLLLLRETLDNPELNIVTVKETYMNVEAAAICDAWTLVLLSEPIFTDLMERFGATAGQIVPWQIRDVASKSETTIEVQDAVQCTGALSRITAITDQSQTTVVWRIHHAFIDGYSALLLREKVRKLLDGETIVQGSSFRKVLHQKAILQNELKASSRAFWSEKQNTFAAATLRLRLMSKTPKDCTDSQKSVIIQCPDEELTAATARSGFTRATYFAAAWALTLGAFMDAEQVCFGLVVSGRDLPIAGALDVVGPLINCLPLFISLEDAEASNDALLQRVYEGMLELSEHQHAVEADGFDRNFDSVFATQFECDGAAAESSGFVDNRLDMQSSIPLSILTKNKGEVQMLYSTAQYAEADMQNVRSVFEYNMSRLLRTPGSAARLNSILPTDMEASVRQWSNCASAESKDSSKGDDLVTLFENVVAHQPDSIAIARGTFEVSYEALDRAAGAVARALAWVHRNEVVCVYADRSIEWLVAIIGILKAGAVYAPLDPSAPQAVRHANFTRSGARAIVSSTRAASRVCLPRQSRWDSRSPAIRRIVVEDLLSTGGCEQYSSSPRRLSPRPDDLAYVCFTSGSTGQPKAVQCTHKGLVAFQKDYHIRLAACPGNVVSQVMSPVFDGSIHEIFSALTYGATLRLASPGQEDPFAHLEHCDSAILTPSIAKVLDPRSYPRLQNVYLVGEAVTQSVCDTWAPGRMLFNMYGPTEATCGATIKRLQPGDDVNLGCTNPSSRVYICDSQCRLLPPGALGELYLAGIQVSHGYIGLPTENAKRFLDDPFMPELGEKMYRTGDFGFWDSVTGDICLIGRKDRQIKLRGFRLDLEDLEARVEKAVPGLAGVAIFRRDDYLVAAIQTSSMDITYAKSLMATALPPYAMPRRVFTVREFPRTRAGKLDYQALVKLHCADVDMHLSTTNLSATEKVLVEVVRSLLKLDPAVTIDRNSNFMQLGGHSILQLHFASRISSIFRRTFSVRIVLGNPVLRDLASAIDATLIDNSRNATYTTTKALGDVSISPIEREWAVKYAKNIGTSSFNVSHVSRLKNGSENIRALASAWDIVLARHSILRCGFQQSRHGFRRTYKPVPPTSQISNSVNVRKVINQQFDLESDYPIRVILSEDVMIICVSHIICDYTTLDHIFAEFTAVYQGLELPLPPRTYQETRWSAALDRSNGEFWTSYLSDMELIDRQYLKGPRTSYSGTSLQFELEGSTSSSLTKISQSLGVTLHQIALAVVGLILQADSDIGNDILLGSPYLNRQEEDLQTVGLFLQPLPIRIPLSTLQQSLNICAHSFLRFVQNSSQSALAHGASFASLLSHLSASSDPHLRAAAAVTAPNHPLFDAMVTFHENDPSRASMLPGVPATPLRTWTEGAKFGIMFEFAAVSEQRTTLRVEYDDSLFAPHEVKVLVARIECALQAFHDNAVMGDLLHSLKKVDESYCTAKELGFGTEMALT